MLGGFFHVAFAEHIVFAAAIGAFKIGHIFYQSHHGNVHQFRHTHRFAYDHRHQFLRRGDHYDSVHGNGLEHRKGDIPCAGGAVDEHIVHIFPQHIGPELFHGTRDDGTPPDHRIGFVFQQHIQGHHFDAGFGYCGINAVIIRQGAVFDAETFGDGRTGDIRIQHGGFITLAGSQHRQQRSDHGLAHAAFAGHHTDDFFNVAGGMGLC